MLVKRHLSLSACLLVCLADVRSFVYVYSLSSSSSFGMRFMIDFEASRGISLVSSLIFSFFFLFAAGDRRPSSTTGRRQGFSTNASLDPYGPNRSPDGQDCRLGENSVRSRLSAPKIRRKFAKGELRILFSTVIDVSNCTSCVVL